MNKNTKTPKEEKKAKRHNFLNQIGAIVLGTTISLIVTTLHQPRQHHDHSYSTKNYL